MRQQCYRSKSEATRLLVALSLLTALGCSSSPSSPSGNDVTSGGSNAIGGNGGVSAATGGTTAHASVGGTLAVSGGNSAAGGSNTDLGGKNATGGSNNTSAGGTSAAGGIAGTGLGGTTQSTLATGGTSARGGSGGLSAGGTSTGSSTRTGGTSGVLVGTGGTPGSAGAGGTASTGGRAAGGSAGSGASAGNTFYVATTGDDTNPGTKDKPFKTVAAAQLAVRASSDRGKIPLTVSVATGTYYITKPIVFTSADSGTQATPVTYRGGGSATLSGGVSLSNLTWTAYKNGIMQASVPTSTFANYSFDDGKAAPNVNTSAPGSSGPTYGFSSVLFLNGQRQHMARYPNYKDPTQAYGGNASDAHSRPGSWAHAPTSSQPAYLHGVHAQLWGSEDYVVTSKSQQNGPLCNG